MSDEMPDDSVLRTRLEDLIAAGDASQLTARALRTTLEEEYGIDLNEKKEWIKDTVKEIVGIKEEEDEGVEIQESESKGVEIEEGDSSHPLLTDAMAAVCGHRRANHFAVVKFLWAYIKKNDLQNPDNKNQIICDDKLRAVFGVDSVTSFGMSKLISGHIIKDSRSATAKTPRRASTDDADDAPAAKKQKTPSTKSKAPATYTGSKELAEFLGEEVQNRFAITKRMWKYIKDNELQDPDHRRTIICDEKLKSLFGVDTFDSFKMATLISAHFPKKDKS